MLGEMQGDTSAVPMRLLCLDPQEPSWTSLAMALESRLGRPLRLRWCDSTSVAMSLLRSEQFDCILVACFNRDRSFWLRNPPSQVIQAIRSVGCDDPVLALIDSQWDHELSALAELDCEVISPNDGWEATSLAPWMLRAIRRNETQREYHRLAVRDSRRASWEREESLQQLQQQRDIAARFLEDSVSADNGRPAPTRDTIPNQVKDYYLELLRTYVIMGAGNLSEDLAHLSHGLAQEGVSMSEAFNLHLDCLTRLIEGLGTQSLRHILSRSNLLSVEFLLNMHRQHIQDVETPVLGSYGIELLDPASSKSTRP